MAYYLSDQECLEKWPGSADNHDYIAITMDQPLSLSNNLVHPTALLRHELLSSPPFHRRGTRGTEFKYQAQSCPNGVATGSLFLHLECLL